MRHRLYELSVLCALQLQEQILALERVEQAKTPGAPCDTMTGTGVGRYDGVDGATIQFTFTDAGEPGTKDLAVIKIYDASGTQLLDFGQERPEPRIARITRILGCFNPCNPRNS